MIKYSDSINWSISPSVMQVTKNNYLTHCIPKTNVLDKEIDAVLSTTIFSFFFLNNVFVKHLSFSHDQFY